jgi:hypothetical protein
MPRFFFYLLDYRLFNNRWLLWLRLFRFSSFRLRRFWNFNLGFRFIFNLFGLRQS